MLLRNVTNHIVQVRVGIKHISLAPDTEQELPEGEYSVECAIREGYLVPVDRRSASVDFSKHEKMLQEIADWSFGRIFLISKVGVVEKSQNVGDTEVLLDPKTGRRARVTGVRGMGGPSGGLFPGDNLDDLDEVEQPWKTNTRGKGLRILELESELPFWVEGYSIIKDERESPKRRIIYRVKPHAAGKFLEDTAVHRLYQLSQEPMFVMGECVNLITGLVTDKMKEHVEWRAVVADAKLLIGEEGWSAERY